MARSYSRQGIDQTEVAVALFVQHIDAFSFGMKEDQEIIAGLLQLKHGFIKVQRLGSVIF